MCAFEEHPSKKIKTEVRNRSWRVFLGSKGVQEEFLGVLGVHYEGHKVYDATTLVVLML
jgi:hypothetical protein